MKFGIIGVGKWGRKLTGEYVALKRENVLEEVAIYDSDPTNVGFFSTEKDVKIYPTLDELIKNVDAVHISTPNKYHYELASKALQSGKHVLLEKPLTTSKSDADKLIELAERQKLILKVGHIYRFANVFDKVKTLYKENYFGDVYYMNFYWTHLAPYTEEVDILWDLLVHPLDIYNIITEQWPDRFFGLASPFRRKKLNEAIFCAATSKNGPVSTCNISWLSPIKKREIEIIGSKRSALIKAVDQQITIFEADAKISIEVKTSNTIREEIINFEKDIGSGKNTINPASIGARTVELIEKAEQSINK